MCHALMTLTYMIWEHVEITFCGFAFGISVSVLVGAV
jgi:hypothetical protein